MNDLFGELGCFCGFETALTCEGSGPAGGQLVIEYRNPEVDYSSQRRLNSVCQMPSVSASTTVTNSKRRSSSGVAW